MDWPCITLSVEKATNFSWQQGYSMVTDEELKMLLKKGKELVHSLEAEAEARQLMLNPEMSQALSACIEDVQNTTKRWGYTGRLEGIDVSRIRAACRSLKSQNEKRHGRIYRAFIRDISRTCDHTTVLLCAASLRIKRIVDLPANDKLRLLQYLVLPRSSDISSALSSLEEYDLSAHVFDSPGLTPLTEFGAPQDIGSLHGGLKRKLATETADTAAVKRSCRQGSGHASSSNLYDEMDIMEVPASASNMRAIQTAFEVPRDVFEQIWSLSDEWQAELPLSIILTIPTEDRVASIMYSIPRLNAIRFGRQFNLPQIYPTSSAS